MSDLFLVCPGMPLETDSHATSLPIFVLSGSPLGVCELLFSFPRFSSFFGGFFSLLYTQKKTLILFATTSETEFVLTFPVYNLWVMPIPKMRSV